MDSTRATKSTHAPSEKPSRRANGARRGGIPPEALDYLAQELAGLKVRELDAEVRGRFCYVYYDGGPLCRLGYRGELEEWDFAIYRYSRGSYGVLELAPTETSVRSAVSMSLNAYGFR